MIADARLRNDFVLPNLSHALFVVPSDDTPDWRQVVLDCITHDVSSVGATVSGMPKVPEQERLYHHGVQLKRSRSPHFLEMCLSHLADTAISARAEAREREETRSDCLHYDHNIDPSK